ncbi:MAG: hypothetical protein AAB426_08140, partial [Myxococcota bacterium]
DARDRSVVEMRGTLAAARDRVTQLETDLVAARAQASQVPSPAPTLVTGVEAARNELKELQRVMRPVVLAKSVDDDLRKAIIEAYGRVSRVLKELAAELGAEP